MMTTTIRAKTGVGATIRTIFKPRDVFLHDGKSLLVTRLLKDLESLLLPYHFYRVHHSHLVNLKYVRKYIRGDGGQVIMQNGDVIDVARRKKEEFLKLFNY